MGDVHLKSGGFIIDGMRYTIKWAIVKELEKHVPYKYLVKVMHD